MCPYFAHSVAGHGFISTKKEEKGKHMLQAAKAIHLGLEPKTSAYSFVILEKNIIMSSNQTQFDVTQFPFWKKKMV
jgi:hypothetical protein